MRNCEVTIMGEAEPALFHRWCEEIKPVSASPMIGGAPAGHFRHIFALVELCDGSCRLVDPHVVRFTRPERICRNLNPDSYRNFHCSLCGEMREQGLEAFKFCPNCEAKVVEK